jgi:DNA repair exonuclease SbcCD ATPase subunit
MGNQNQQPWPETDRIAFDLERFSSLSSEMVALLETLTQDINRSAQELRDIRAAVDAGKTELAALRESEREVSVIKPQLEDLRLQKEGLENLIADQRNAWEEEKTKQDLKEKEREENLKALRQREEKEYRLMRENEQMQARQKFEEELEAMRQKSAEIRTREETDILARESMLKKKEQELSRLMQELEKFLSGLAGRKGAAAANPSASDLNSKFQIPDSRLRIS